jgi:hypothetical protein
MLGVMPVTTAATFTDKEYAPVEPERYDDAPT